MVQIQSLCNKLIWKCCTKFDGYKNTITHDAMCITWSCTEAPLEVLILLILSKLRLKALSVILTYLYSTTAAHNNNFEILLVIFSSVSHNINRQFLHYGNFPSQFFFIFILYTIWNQGHRLSFTLTDLSFYSFLFPE